MRQLIIILLLSISATVNATTYYVSNSGDDSNSGLTQVVPWQTIDKVNSFTFAAGDQILFKRGDTFYGAIVATNKGRVGSPITYGAYGFGDKPIITGLKTVTGGWTDLGFNIWESTNAVSALPDLKTVIINGKSTPMGRWPNGDASYPFLPNFNTFQSSTGTGIGASSITSSSLSGGPDWTGAEIVTRATQWSFHRDTITDQSGNTLSFSGIGGGLTAGWGFFIQNDIKTLDQAGEWYYNSSTKKLTIYSVGAPTDVQVSTVETLFYLFSNIPAINYTDIDNINFTGANTNAIKISGNLIFSVTNCDISYSGMEGMLLYGGGIQSGIINNNTFSNNGSSGIFTTSAVANLTVTNNQVNMSGVVSVYKQDDYTNGGMGINAPGSLIQYNTVDSSAYCGITFSGSNIEVRNNFVNHSALVRADAAGIYTGFASQTGKVIDGNVILNSIGNKRGTKNKDLFAFGIYSDDLGNHIQITNNTIANSTAGIYIHNSNNLVVRANTIYNAGAANSSDAAVAWANAGIAIDGNGDQYSGSVHDNRVVGNIVVATSIYQYALNYYYANGSDNEPSNFGYMDSNYYARPINDNLTIKGRNYGIGGGAIDYSLGTWRAYTGFDTHSNKSPRAISNPAQISFYYNPNNSDSTLSLGGSTYVDMANVSYTGDVVLPAYSSLVLINTGSLITPTITWTNPSAITYGTALSSTQLNASTGVSGSFSYNYSLGAVLNAGSYTLTVTFTPTDGTTYTTATKSVPLTVNKATATLSYSGLTKTYNGSPQSPTITTSPLGLTGVNTTYNGVGAAPTNAGSYAVITGLANANYTATTISNTFTINKATIIISVSNLTQNYTGSPLPVTVTTSPSVSGISVTYDGSATVPTNAGSYTVVASLTNTNYQATPVTTTLVINKATPIVSWSNPSAITYGTALSSTQLNATSSVSGSFTYTPSSGSILNAGSNILSVNFTPTDATNYNSANNTTVSLTVNKATATISLSNLTQTYDGNPKPVTVTTSPIGLTTITTTYNGSATVPSAVGSYSISSSLNNSNYTATPATGTLVISSSAANIFITNYANLVYNGNAQTPTVTSAYSYDITYNGSSTAPTNVGSYTTIATINDGVHVGADTVTMTIIKATPVIIWNNPSSITYGTALSSTQLNATTSVVGAFSYTPASGTILNSGTYVLSTSFTPTDASNYNNATSEVNITVNKASATLSLSNLNQVYDGSTKPVTVTSSPSGLDGISITYNGSATVPTNAGSYPIAVTLTNSNYSASPVSGTLVISKATPILSWATPQPLQSGSKLTSTQLNATSNIAGSFSYSLPLGTTVTTGAIGMTATFTPSNSNYNSGTVSVLLNVYGNPIINFIIGDYYENK